MKIKKVKNIIKGYANTYDIKLIHIIAPNDIDE